MVCVDACCFVRDTDWYTSHRTIPIFWHGMDRCQGCDVPDASLPKSFAPCARRVLPDILFSGCIVFLCVLSCMPFLFLVPANSTSSPLTLRSVWKSDFSASEGVMGLFSVRELPKARCLVRCFDSHRGARICLRRDVF